MRAFASPRPILNRAGWVAVVSAITFRLCDWNLSTGRLLAAAVAVGAAAAIVDLFLFRSIARRARAMRRQVENLLRPAADELAPSPVTDEVSALAASLETATPQVRRVVESLQHERSRLEAILGTMIEGVVAVDPLLRITFLNRAFAELMAAATPVPSGTPLVHVVRDHAFLDMFAQVFATGQPLRERLALTSGGSFEVQVAPLSGDPNRGALAMLHDITELERLDRVRKDFVANVSHELRTPLAAVCGYAETLLEGGLEDPANNRRFLEIILGKARQLNNIVSDLLALSSLEGGKSPIPQPVSLRESIESALRTVEPVARTRGVRLACASFEDLTVLAHELRLEQVFVNLLDNAVKFNRPQGEVRVVVTRDPVRAVVRVEDTGLGIPSRELPRIFERFYRVDKARSRATGGTGLGLAIVKHAIEQMGGSVAVESTLGHGSVFTVCLPPVENNISANKC